MLANGLTATGAQAQIQRFDLGGMAPGEARSFSVTCTGHESFLAWGAIQFGACAPADCNAANNTAVQAAP